MKSKPTAGIIAIALGALTVIIPTLLFPVCTEMLKLANGSTVFMKCHWTQMAEVMLGVIIALDGILLIGFKKREVRMVLSIMLFLFGIASLLTATTIIGMCESVSMPCRVSTQPALIAVSTLTMALGLGNLLLQRKLSKKESTYIQ